MFVFPRGHIHIGKQQSILDSDPEEKFPSLSGDMQTEDQNLLEKLA